MPDNCSPVQGAASISKIFRIRFAQFCVRPCLDCKATYRSDLYENMLELEVNASTTTLEQALKSHLWADTPEGMKCEDCQTEGGFKCSRLAGLPHKLFIALKRTQVHRLGNTAAWHQVLAAVCC